MGANHKFWGFLMKSIIDRMWTCLGGEKKFVTIDLVHLTVLSLGFAVFFQGYTMDGGEPSYDGMIVSIAQTMGHVRPEPGQPAQLAQIVHW